MQQLVEHAAVVEKDNVKEQAKRGCTDDDRKEIQRSKELRADLDAVYDEREHERGTHLKHQRKDHEQQRIFHRRTHAWVLPEFHIVGKPRLIDTRRLGAEAGDR
ncbi:hypothetical protein SDC9_171496 [bioreactor metagenome]|uniref:Uncharacterized protein n=1 Tax=bioreactor metagenome TaxID=1076179 RepID=A0A645GDL5_9ZZZZ